MTVRLIKNILLGPGPVQALEHFLKMAERDGYETKNVNNYAGHFEYGQGDEVLGIFAHLDVVPAGSGWKTSPCCQKSSMANSMRGVLVMTKAQRLPVIMV